MAGDWRVHYALGVAAIERQDLSAAWSHFSDAIDSGADRWEPFYGRAWALVHVGDDDRRLAAAEKDLDCALDEYDAGADAAALRADIFKRRGDHERAIEFYLRAVGRSAQRVLSTDGLAESLAELLDRMERSRDGRAAVATCDRIARLFETASLPAGLRDELLAEVIASRAFCRQRDGDQEGALADLRTVARHMPDHPRLPADVTPDPASAGAPGVRRSTEPTFDGVGGIDDPDTFAAKLRQVFDLYFVAGDADAIRDRLAEYGLPSGRSILLFGPSGVGKTYLVRAFSGEYRRRYGRELPMVRLRLNELLNRYVGEDEKNLTEIFDRAIESQPSILFIDEVDSVGMSRESGQDWRIQLTSHLLQEIDRMREEAAAVLLIGSTNRIWSVDLAMQRRFDRLIPAELPGPAARAEIFAVHLAKMGARIRPEGLDHGELARRSHGLTPGDIQKVVGRAIEQLLMDTATSGERRLTEADLTAAIEEYQQPMHVREWLRQSVTALRAAGLNDMATETERMYRPFVDHVAEPTPTEQEWAPVPTAAWDENPEYPLSLMRWLRR